MHRARGEERPRGVTAGSKLPLFPSFSSSLSILHILEPSGWWLGLQPGVGEEPGEVTAQTSHADLPSPLCGGPSTPCLPLGQGGECT